MVYLGFTTLDQLLTTRQLFLLYWKPILVMLLCLGALELLIKKR